jgi:hypothetical protein
MTLILADAGHITRVVGSDGRSIVSVVAVPTTGRAITAAAATMPVSKVTVPGTVPVVADCVPFPEDHLAAKC